MVTSPGRLLERERELGLIGALLDTALAGGDGSVLVIEGPAGIGKTRLTRAARQEADLRSISVLAARGAELEREYPFGVVRQLFELRLRSATAAERELLLEGAAALAAPAVLPEAALSREQLDPAFGAFHGLYWLCANLCADRPLLLVVDDLQWVDQPSLGFLGFLAHRIDTLPLVLLLARRSSAEIDIDFAAEHLQLRPLTEAGVSSFLRLLTDGRIDAEFASACLNATGGNPFLLNQVAVALIERNLSFTSDSVDLVETVGPQAVAAGIGARLRRVNEAAATLARAAAVLGDDTPLVLAAALADLDDAAAAEAAAALTRAGVLEDARPLRFVHPLIRAAVEAGMSGTARVTLHRRAAELLAARGASTAEVAVHLLATEPAADSWTIETLIEAAQQAIARGAPAAAVPMLTRALAEGPARSLRFQLLLELGRAESSVGLPAAAEHLREAHKLASDPLERGRAALALSWSNSRGDSDGRPLRELVEEAIDAVRPVDHDLALELEAARGAILTFQPEDAAEYGDKLERFADLEGRTIPECSLLAHLAHYRMDMGRSAREAVELAERAVANANLVSEAAFDAPWLLSAVLVLRQADHNDTAIRTLNIVLASAKRRGSISAYALASVVRGSVLLRAGEIGEAEGDARAGLDAAPPGSWSRLPAVGILVETLIERNALDEAWKILVENRADDELPDIRPATVLLISRGALAYARGDPTAALADLRLARARLERFSRENAVGLDGRIRTALAQHALGDHAGARAEADAAVAVARKWDTSAAIGGALRARAIVGEPADAFDLLSAAVDQLEQSQQRLEYARALVDLGAVLRRRGDRIAAREPLRQALDLAQSCGGLKLAEHAREELSAAGVRIRREARTGLDALTPSERRVVDRAAAGASNRDIAHALFVTVKTVEMHLGHAYRKLGISSRTELTAHIEVSNRASQKNGVEV
jgi:DNA-binding CsgD family transcriptional regulator